MPVIAFKVLLIRVVLVAPIIIRVCGEAVEVGSNSNRGTSQRSSDPATLPHCTSHPGACACEGERSMHITDGYAMFGILSIAILATFKFCDKNKYIA